MNNLNLVEIIISYFKFHIKGLILFLLFPGILALVFFLYSLPMEPVLYAGFLYLGIGLIFSAIDFVNYYKRHKLLMSLKDSILINIDKLPKPMDIIEKDYNDLIDIMYKKNGEITYNAEVSRSDLMDYYTLWAHQIKTPIAAMRLILQQEESEENMELSMELFKIEQYVEFVMQYLRLESMSSDLVLKEYNLDDIVRQAVRKYARVFIRKKIKLNFGEISCKVLTDKKWLTFVIEQILSNALKYTIKGSISIYMDKNSDKTLVIEDTGIGIAKEDLGRIFERGFTGYNGRMYKKSSGLGLYLCKQILTKLSHRINIESEIDKGTKVKISFETVELNVE